MVALKKQRLDTRVVIYILNILETRFGVPWGGTTLSEAESPHSGTIPVVGLNFLVARFA